MVFILSFSSGCFIHHGYFSAIKWYFKVYWIENNILHIKHGVFVKKESYLNKERVQNISTSSNIIYQMLGLMKLNIEVAGGGNEPEVMLAGIKEDEAKHLISLLHKKETTVKEEIEEEESKTVYQLTAKEVLAAAITSGRFGLVFSDWYFFTQSLILFFLKDSQVK